MAVWLLSAGRDESGSAKAVGVAGIWILRAALSSWRGHSVAGVAIGTKVADIEAARAECSATVGPLHRSTNHTLTVLAVGSVLGGVVWTAGGRHRTRLERREDGRVAIGHATIILLDLAGNATTVRSVADAWDDHANILVQRRLELVVGELHGGLNNIVGKTITKEFLENLRDHELADEFATRLIARASNALLNHVGAELLPGQGRDLAVESTAKGLGEARLGQVENVLDDIVAEWVLHESICIADDVIDHLTLLQTISVIDATLEHTAAVTMSAHSDAVSADSLEDEGSVDRREVVQALLNNVVAIEVLNEDDDVVAECLHDELNLLWSGDILNHLLKCASAVLVESDLGHGWRCILNQDGALIVIGALKQLLAQVVAEWIDHELDHMLFDLIENDLHGLLVALL